MRSLFRYSETPDERVVRRLRSTFANLALVVDDITDPCAIDARADLVIAAEDLLDIATHIADISRDIAWQHSPVPESGETER